MYTDSFTDKAMQRHMDIAEQSLRERIDKSGISKRNPNGAQERYNEEDDYDPIAHRPVTDEPLTSDFAAFVHLVKCAIGTGILFLPHVFRRTGYVMSFICGVLISFLVMHTATLIVRCSQLLCRRRRVPMLDLAQTAQYSFEAGPKWIRRYSHGFNVFTNIVVCFVQYQAAVIYILYVSTSFQQVIEFFWKFEMDVRIYILIFLPFTGSLGFVPNLTYLMPISTAGTICLILGFCIACYYFLTDIPDPARLDAFTYVLPVPMYCAIFLFALHNMTLYLPLENTMKHPTHLPRLIVYSIILNALVYLSFGFLGYNKYPKACDTIIKNLPLDEILSQIVKITISLSVLFTIGLAYYVPVTILWPMIYLKISTESLRYQRLSKAGVQLAGVIGTTLLAIAVPQMVPLLGLLSAISITTIMLLIPILIETMTKWTEITSLMLVKNAIIFLLWITILISGAIEGTLSIIREYGMARPEEC